MIINKHNLEDIGLLLDEVHDRFFDIDQMDFDKIKSEVKLYLSDNIKGPFNRTLTIKQVYKVTFDDTEKIGIYDINKIIIDPKTETLNLISGFPLKIIFYLMEDYEVSIC